MATSQRLSGEGMGMLTHTPRKRIEQALRSTPDGLTTIQLVEQYGVMRLGARIRGIRHQLGLNIQKVMEPDRTAAGNSHNLARDVLLPSKWNGAARQ